MRGLGIRDVPLPLVRGTVRELQIDHLGHCASIHGDATAVVTGGKVHIPANRCILRYAPSILIFWLRRYGKSFFSLS